MVSVLYFIAVATTKCLQTCTFKKEKGFYFLSQPRVDFSTLGSNQDKVFASVFFKQSDRNKVKVEMKIKCSPGVPITTTAAYGCRVILLNLIVA